MSSNINIEDLSNTSNIKFDDETFKMLDEKLESCIGLEYTVMKTEEYKDFFAKAKQVYPHEYEYLIHMACISYFQDKSKEGKPEA